MKRAIVMVLVLVASGCGCSEAHELTVEGEAPPYADLVLRVAQEHCDRPIVGVFRWTQERVGDHSGYCSWDGSGCPMDARSTTPVTWTSAGPVTAPAMYSLEAHEIGHWCLRRSDSATDHPHVERWAAVVNAEAWAIAFPDVPSPFQNAP